MNGTWNLEHIYTGFDSPEYEGDFAVLEQTAKEIVCFARERMDGDSRANQPDVEAYVRLQERFQNLYTHLHAYSFFRLSVNVEDKEAADRETRLEMVASSLKGADNLFGPYIKGVPDMKVFCRGNETLEQYVFYLEKVAEHNRYLLPVQEERLLSDMSRTGSKAWSRLQTQVASTAMVTLEEDGETKTLPISAMASLPKTDSKEVKRKRFEAELLAYQAHEGISAMALNSIKGESLTTSKLRGYASPLHQTLSDCHMDQDILDCMLESIEGFLPDICRYYEIKARHLGYENGLPYYERETSIVEDRKTYSYEDGRWMILRAFASFSPVMYRFGKEAFDGEWIDYRAVKGKQPGASCDGVYAVGESRIRVTYNGSLADVNTLAHELGHGYHNMNLFQEGILNDCYDLPIAETASKFSEILLKEEWKTELPTAETIYIDDFILSGFINTIADIQSRFYFENQVFERRKEQELSVEELKTLMLEAQKKSYGPSLDSALLHPYMWLNKPHYYFPTRNYYNFPYSFGTLLSIGMYQHYLGDKKGFVRHYDSFLSSTGKLRVHDLCKMMGIDVKKPEFWQSSLQYIKNLLDQFEKNLLAEKLAV